MRPVFYTNCNSIVWSIGLDMNLSADGAHNIESYNPNYGFDPSYAYCNNQASQNYYGTQYAGEENFYQADQRLGCYDNNYGFDNQFNGFNGFVNQHDGINNQSHSQFNGFDNNNGFGNQYNGSYDQFYGLNNQFNGSDNQYLEQNREIDQSAMYSGYSNNWNTTQNSLQHGYEHSSQQQNFISTGYNFQSEKHHPRSLSNGEETRPHDQARSEAAAEVVKEHPDPGNVIPTCVLGPESLLDELELSGLDGMEKCVEKLEASVEERKVDGSCVSKPLKQPRKQLRLARESAVGEEALKVIYGKSEEEFRFYANTHTHEEQVYIAGKLRVNHKNALAQSKRRKKLDNIIIGLNKEVECIRKRKEKLTKERKDLEKLRNDWINLLRDKQDLLEKHLESKGIDPALLKMLKHSTPGTEKGRFIEAIRMLIGK